MQKFVRLDECAPDNVGAVRGNSEAHHSLNPWLDSNFPLKPDLLFLESDNFLKFCKSLKGNHNSDQYLRILPPLPAYLCTESAADIMQARLLTYGSDMACMPDLAQVLPRILWKRLMFASGLYILQVICNLASPLVTFALLRWAEDEGLRCLEPREILNTQEPSAQAPPRGRDTRMFWSLPSAAPFQARLALPNIRV